MSCRNGTKVRFSVLFKFNWSCENVLQKRQAFMKANIMDSCFSKDDYH